MPIKPKVGQILYSLNIGNSARHQKQKLNKVVVSKVGRKYFTCCQPDCIDKKWMQTKYYLEDWCEKSDYIANSTLYLNPQEWEDDKEISRICSLIYASFQYGRNQLNLPLQELRTIEGFIKAKAGDNVL